MAAILVWALALNSTKWFEWRAVAESCPTAGGSEAGILATGLMNLTSHQEMREQWTFDRTGLGVEGLVNLSRNWEHIHNSTLKLTSTTEEVASGNCELQVVKYLKFTFFPSNFLFLGC